MKSDLMLFARSGRGRQYLIEFGAALLAYLIVLPASILVINSNPDAPWTTLVALLPAVPAAFVVRAYVRHLRRLDELELRIQYEGLAIGFWASALVMFSYGFLEGIGFPHLNWTFTWAVMLGMWGVGVVISARRYR